MITPLDSRQVESLEITVAFTQLQSSAQSNLPGGDGASATAMLSTGALPGLTQVVTNPI
jgi:hypothetical protein